jgi:hypothetical protein
LQELRVLRWAQDLHVKQTQCADCALAARNPRPALILPYSSGQSSLPCHRHFRADWLRACRIKRVSGGS